MHNCRTSDPDFWWWLIFFEWLQLHKNNKPEIDCFCCYWMWWSSMSFHPWWKNEFLLKTKPERRICTHAFYYRLRVYMSFCTVAFGKRNRIFLHILTKLITRIFNKERWEHFKIYIPFIKRLHTKSTINIFTIHHKTTYHSALSTDSAPFSLTLMLVDTVVMVSTRVSHNES